MKRRAHNKMRNGCVQCRQRHIKCDQRRPECVNCAVSSRQCSFAQQVLSGSSWRDDPQTPSRSSATHEGPHPATAATTTTTSTTHDDAPNDDSNLSLDQLRLLHHFLISTASTVGDALHQQEFWRTKAIDDALTHPYLMQGVLAVAALHLSHLNPDKADYYEQQAAEFQSRGLRGYNKALLDVDQNTFGPAIVFAGLVAVHYFGEMSKPANHTLAEYLSRTVIFAKLSQGFRYISTTYWQAIIESEYVHIIDVGLAEPDEVDGRYRPGLGKLSSMVEANGNEPEQAYLSAISELRRIYASVQRPVDKSPRVFPLFAWAALVQEDYFDKLNQRRPEALVILAHFAVLLHLHRSHWIAQDTGFFLVHAIHNHLGSYWREMLAWPLEMVSRGDAASI